MLRPNMTLSISARLMMIWWRPMPSTRPASAPMIVNLVMYRKLKRVQMVESLKSVE